MAENPLHDEMEGLLNRTPEDVSDNIPSTPGSQNQYGSLSHPVSVTADAEEEDDVLLEHGMTASFDRGLHANSNTQSLMHLIKGNIGTGILALPIAIKYAGLWTGTILIGVIGLIALHCMMLLIQSAHHMCRKTGRPHLDYGGVGKKAIENYVRYISNYSEARRVFIGKSAKVTINTFLCITQLGFCTVYILFIAKNVSQVIEAATKGTDASQGFTLPIRLYAFIVFLLLIPYVFVRKLSHLAPFSLLANILTLVGLIITVQYCFRDLPPASTYPAFTSIAELPLYFGIAIYSFEGIGVVLPIENKMKHPQDFPGCNGVLSTGVYLVIIMYITVGFFGYMKFGDSVQGSITLDLPSDDWLYLSVKLIFSIGIYITYGLQFYVPVIVLWTGIRRKLTNLWLIENGEILLRLGFLTLTFLLSISIPHLDLMISLIGALACSALAFIFPPIIQMMALWPDGLLTWGHVVKNFFIIVIGLIGFVSGTVSTFIKLAEVM